MAVEYQNKTGGLKGGWLRFIYPVLALAPVGLVRVYLAGLGARPGWLGSGWVYLAGLGASPGWFGSGWAYLAGLGARPGWVEYANRG